jgi:hypothetical protein
MSATGNPFADLLLASDEAVRLSREWTTARDERDRLRQRVADLAKAAEDLAAAEQTLRDKSLEAAIYLQSLASSIMS